VETAAVTLWEARADGPGVVLRTIPRLLVGQWSAWVDKDQLWTAEAVKGGALQLRQWAPQERVWKWPWKGKDLELSNLAFRPGGRGLVVQVKGQREGEAVEGDRLECWPLEERPTGRQWAHPLYNCGSEGAWFNPDGALLVFGYMGNGAGVEATSGALIRRIVRENEGHAQVLGGITHPADATVLLAAGDLRGVAFAPDGRQVYACRADGWLQGDVVSRERLSPTAVVWVHQRDWAWKAHQGPIRALAVHPTGQWLASGGDDRTLGLWECASGRELARWEAHDRPVTAVAFHPDGRTLVSGDASGRIKFWDLERIRQGLRQLGLGW
jgi:hypothetical protein